MQGSRQNQCDSVMSPEVSPESISILLRGVCSVYCSGNSLDPNVTDKTL